TYGHRFKKFSHPVRSGLYKLEIGGLVVRWVTTGESPLSYVFEKLFHFYDFLLKHVIHLGIRKVVFPDRSIMPHYTQPVLTIPTSPNAAHGS
ncbi:hypothetical protein COCVIDRAFT_112081, partial [Bipolaris victoriae FI3]